MGQQSSSISHQLRKYRFKKQQYTKIGHQTWQNNQDQFDQLKQAKVFFCDQQAIHDFQKIYYIRKASDFLVRAAYFDLEEDKEICSSKKVGTLYIESDQLRLSDITDIPFPDYLHLYYQSLRGFQQLFEEYGAFGPQEEHICINTHSQVKVWHNSNLHCNNVEHPMAPTSQTQMLRQILYILKRNSDGNISKERQSLHRSLQLAHTFKSALQNLNAWCKAQNVIVPLNLACVEKHGLIVHNLAEESRHSKKFDLFQEANKKHRRGDDMKIPQPSLQISPNLQLHPKYDNKLSRNLQIQNSTWANPWNPPKPQSASTFNLPTQKIAPNSFQGKYIRNEGSFRINQNRYPQQARSGNQQIIVSLPYHNQIYNKPFLQHQIRNYHMSAYTNPKNRYLTVQQQQKNNLNANKQSAFRTTNQSMAINSVINSKDNQINLHSRNMPNWQPIILTKPNQFQKVNINSKSVSPSIIDRNQNNNNSRSLSPYSGSKIVGPKTSNLIRIKKENYSYYQPIANLNPMFGSFKAYEQQKQSLVSQFQESPGGPPKSPVFPKRFHYKLNQGSIGENDKVLYKAKSPVSFDNKKSNFREGWNNYSQQDSVRHIKQDDYGSLESIIERQLYADLKSINQKLQN